MVNDDDVIMTDFANQTSIFGDGPLVRGHVNFECFLVDWDSHKLDVEHVGSLFSMTVC